MPPSETALAALYSDETVEDALSTILHSDTGSCPPDRVALALACARLYTRDSGFSTSNYTSTSSCLYFSSYVRCRHSITRASPVIATLNTTNPTTPSIIAVRDAHRLISDTLTLVRSRLKTLDADHRTWTDGSTHTDVYHPQLSTDYSIPSPTTPTYSTTPELTFSSAVSSASSRLFSTSTHGSRSRPSQAHSTPPTSPLPCLTIKQPAWSPAPKRAPVRFSCDSPTHHSRAQFAT